MHILFTQSLKEWDKEEDFLIRSTLSAKGLGFFHDPLLQITYFPGPSSLFQEKWAGILVTSQHAVWALRQQISLIKTIPLWCVGEKTGALARKLGFQTVYEAQGSVESLQTLLLDAKEGTKDCFLYVRGQDIRKDLKADLQHLGYSIKEYIAYKATLVENFSLPVQKAFQENTLKGVCLFSMRGAQAFFTLMERNGFLDTRKDVVLFCLSSEIASYGRQKGYKVQCNEALPSLENLLKMCVTYFTKKNAV